MRKEVGGRHVIVLEDEPTLRAELAEFLRLQGYDVAEAGTVAQFRELALRRAPSVILLDLLLPDGDGLELLKALRAEGSRAAVVVLSCLCGSGQRVRGLELGADAYLEKEADLHEIDATIRTVLRRAERTPATWRFSVCTWRLMAPNGMQVHLTSSESVLIKLLLELPGSPVSRDHIAASLPRPREGSDRSVDALLRRLRKKVEQNTGLPLPVNMVYSLGYSFTAHAILDS